MPSDLDHLTRLLSLQDETTASATKTSTCASPARCGFDSIGWRSNARIGSCVRRHDDRRVRLVTMTGTIAKLIRDKGFGFIKGVDDSEYFFHSTAVKNGGWDELEEGQRVTFDATKGPKGPRAEQVTPQ